MSSNVCMKLYKNGNQKGKQNGNMNQSCRSTMYKVMYTKSKGCGCGG